MPVSYCNNFLLHHLAEFQITVSVAVFLLKHHSFYPGNVSFGNFLFRKIEGQRFLLYLAFLLSEIKKVKKTIFIWKIFLCGLKVFSIYPLIHTGYCNQIRLRVYFTQRPTGIATVFPR